MVYEHSDDITGGSTPIIRGEFVGRIQTTDGTDIKPPFEMMDRSADAHNKETKKLSSKGNSKNTCIDDVTHGEDVVENMDGGWGWMVVVGNFVVNWLVIGLVGSYGAIHVEVLETFAGTTVTEASWVPALLTSIAVGLSPIAGAVSKIYKCRNMAFLGGLLCCLGFSLSFFATSVFHLYITLGVILGIGSALSMMASVIAVNLQFEKRRAMAMGFCFSGVAFGSLTLPTIIKTLVDAYALQGALLIMGAAFAHICACALLFTPNGKWPNARQKIVKCEAMIGNSYQNDALDLDDAIGNSATKYNTIMLTDKSVKVSSIYYYSSTTNLLHSVSHLFNASSLIANNDYDKKLQQGSSSRAKLEKTCAVAKRGLRATTKFLSVFLDFGLFEKWSFTLTIISSICISGVYPHTLIYVPAYAMTLGFTKGDAGRLLSIASVIDLFNRPFNGYLADLKVVKVSHMLMISCSVVAAGTVCIPLVSSYGALAICTTVVSTGIGTTFTLLPVILAENHGVQLLHSTFGMLRLFQGGFILLMGPLTGAIKDHTGYYEVCFFVMAAIVFGGAIAMLFMPCALRHEKKKSSQVK